jgi:hypothetical protein
MKRNREESLLKGLFRRRVPQALGIYLGVSWAIIEFVDWLTNRFMLSPHWIDLILVILLFFIPSMIILAYFHGSPGKDRSNRIEKIVVPLNIILIVLLAFFLFADKDLGKVSKKVTVSDESGKIVEKVIPKREFKKKLAIFYIDNKTGDDKFKWISLGLSGLIEYDLSQDPFIVVKSVQTIDPAGLKFGFYDLIKKAGFKEAVNIPIMLKRQLAMDQNLDYFTSGALFFKNGTYRLELDIYKASNAKELAAIKIFHKNLFLLVDELTLKIKEALSLPQAHINSVIDLPLKDIYTNNIAAVEYSAKSEYSAVILNDWSGADEGFNPAIKALKLLQQYSCQGAVLNNES